MNSFTQELKSKNISLKRNQTDILQINVGKLCNLACHHCHVEASPVRTEVMQKDVVDRLIDLVRNSQQIKTIDLTGGAPELNPHFRHMIQTFSKMGKTIIDRCNLTVLYEDGQEETAAFLAQHKVQVVASLPCYSKANVEKQRGKGVFDKSVEALKSLNALGYGMPGTGLILDLVYNPGGAFLPPAQEKLESDYKKELKEFFNISFNHLYTITNMPIKRFLDDLNRQKKYADYMQLLIDNFNPHSAEGIMCRNLISIGYDGQIYDCDFNQMLELPLREAKKTVFDIQSFSELENKEITFANHCYGCTAGAGSSCGGALT